MGLSIKLFKLKDKKTKKDNFIRVCAFLLQCSCNNAK
jgi:hypothetical protein